MFKSVRSEGASNIVGILLLVALTVVIAALIGVFVLDIAGNSQETATASVEYNDETDVLTLEDSLNTSKLVLRVNGEKIGEITKVGGSKQVVKKGTLTVIAIPEGGTEKDGSVVRVVENAGSKVLAGGSGNNSSSPTCSEVSYNGSGTTSNPYIVNTDYQLQCMSKDLDGVYKLASDIDLSKTDQWNSGNGFKPVGTSSSPFTGELRGNNKTIKNPTILRGGSDNIGIIGYSNGATVSDITVTNPDITGRVNTGSLIGQAVNTKINNPTVDKGTIKGNVSRTGGIIGYAYDSTTINNPKTKNNISVTGSGLVGGIVGYMEKNNTLNGNDNTIPSTVSISGSKFVGGITGVLKASTVNNINTKQVSLSDAGGSGSYYGFGVGYMFNNSTINNVTVNGGSIDVPKEYVGGVVGNMSDSAATNIIAKNVTVTGNNYVGGLAGSASGGSDSHYISKSYAYATVNVKDGGSGTQYASTFVGDVFDVDIKQSFAVGNVNPDGDRAANVGGIAGNNSSGVFTNVYANSTIYGRNVGGLVGDNNGTIKKSYFVGEVVSRQDTAGSIVGFNFGTVQDTYYNSDKPAFGENFGSTSNNNNLTTSEMQGSSAKSNMSAFDFSSIWTTVSGDFPELQNNRDNYEGDDGGTAQGNPNVAPKCTNITYSGSGTTSDPYQVNNVDELQCMSKHDTATFKIVSDIDASDTETEGWNYGRGFDSIGSNSNPWKGNLYGNNKTVSNLYINSESTGGVFDSVGRAFDGNTEIIRNLTLNSVNYDVTAGGGIAGGITESTVENVSVSGNITARGTEVGGVVGTNFGGVVRQSSVDVSMSIDGSAVVGMIVGENTGQVKQNYALGSITVKNSVDANTSKEPAVGGLVGFNNHEGSSSTVVKNNYSGVDVDSQYIAGGIVGKTLDGDGTGDTATITKNYSYGSVSGKIANSNDYVGASVGFVGTGGQVSDIYHNDGTATESDTVGLNNGTTSNLVGLTTSEMQGSSASSNMSALDFTSIWTTVTGDYPELQNNREP